mgnify:CR=1 FL=1
MTNEQVLRTLNAPNRLADGQYRTNLPLSITLDTIRRAAALMPKLPDRYVIVAKDWEALERVFAAHGWPVKKVGESKVLMFGGIEVRFDPVAGDDVYCLRKDAARPFDPNAPLPMTTPPPSFVRRNAIYRPPPAVDPAAPGTDHTVTTELPPPDQPDETRRD